MRSSAQNTRPYPPDASGERKQGVFRALGLGVVTGACDDDPVAIGTYASAGASFGPSFLWTAPVTFPMMYAVVYLSSKLGQVTGKGLVPRHQGPLPALAPVADPDRRPDRQHHRGRRGPRRHGGGDQPVRARSRSRSSSWPRGSIILALQICGLLRADPECLSLVRAGAARVCRLGDPRTSRIRCEMLERDVHSRRSNSPPNSCRSSSP